MKLLSVGLGIVVLVCAAHAGDSGDHWLPAGQRPMISGHEKEAFKQLAQTHFCEFRQSDQTSEQEKLREQVHALVKQLGSAVFAKRTAAQKALLDIGPAAVPQLDQMKADADLETRRRIEQIRYQLVGYADDILAFLKSQPRHDDDTTIEVLDNIKNLVAAHQPKSGDLLLSIIGNRQDKLHRPAVNLFAHTWQSQTTGQVETFLQKQFRFQVPMRPAYPAKIEAWISMGYYLEYGWETWPKDFQLKTRTTHVLDGKAYGKPFVSEGPLNGTGGINTGKLTGGKHACQFTVAYEFIHRGKGHQGKVRSPEYSFEILPAGTADDLIAPYDEATDRLVRQTLKILEHEQEGKEQPLFPVMNGFPPEDPWRPQITWKTEDGKDAGLHLPLWEVAKPLPVDLCFAVEFEDLSNGKKIKGSPLGCFKGKASQIGYLDLYPVEIFKGRDGFLKVKVTLTPSRSLALSDPSVTRYFAGTISRELRLKLTTQKNDDRRK